MKTTLNKLELFAYLSITLAALLVLGSVLQSVLAPLTLSIIFALVILPMVNFFERIGFNRLFSSLTAVALIAVFLMGIGLVGFLQLQELGSSMGDLEQTFFSRINKIGDKLPSELRPPTLHEVDDIEKVLPDDLGLLGGFVGDAIKLTTEVFSTLTLIPIFVFFILFYRRRISKFLRWIDSKGTGDFKVATQESKDMVQSYLSGLGLVILINATLATLGLWTIGISYALLLGVLSALLTVIPYIGTFLGALIPILFAFITKDSIAYGFGVMALYAVIQFTENNFISPIILGNSVNVNPFASVLALLLMGQYWGIIGMVMAVPLMGILVILFDHSESLQSFNLLLKNDQSD
jgi:predicted PurR-regulated permease PerM